MTILICQYNIDDIKYIKTYSLVYLCMNTYAYLNVNVCVYFGAIYLQY